MRKVKVFTILGPVVIAFGLFCQVSIAKEKSSCTEGEELFVSKDFTEPGGFTSGIEGPACDSEGNLYVVNYKKQGTIGKVTPAGQCTVFVELPKGSIGNGIRFNSKNEMLVADYVNHNILKVDMRTKEVSVYANEPTMNQPNDIAIGKNDLLYASDPNWGKNNGQIWRIDTDGKVSLLETDMGTTNGIEVGPDEKKLYVNESNQRNVWVYDLSLDGKISNKRLLINFPDFGMDGMRCDTKGNLYIARYSKGTVAKVSPEGKVLLEVKLTGKNPSNIAFGGPDGRTCYVTLADNGNIETFRVDQPGRSWQLFQERKPSSVKEENIKPQKINLLRNYPNPFNSSTVIEYSLPERTMMELAVYDSVGQKVATIKQGVEQEGKHSTIWNAENFSGGVYFYKLKASGFTKINKMLLLK